MAPNSVMLNDLERPVAVILRYFIEFGRFGANYVKVVEDRHTVCDVNVVRRI